MSKALKKVPIKEQIAQMSVGSTLTFDVGKINVVRNTACILGFRLGRRYPTSTNRDERTVTVTRTE